MQTGLRLRGEWVWVLVAFATGCASISNVQTADTIGRGRVEVGVEPGVWGGVGQGSAFIPHVDASVRIGVADRVDLGVRGGMSFLELQTKFLLTEPFDPHFALSLAPTIGGLVVGGSGASVGLLNIGVPVLIGIKLSGGSQFIIGPRMQNWLVFAADSSTGGTAYVGGVGGSLGFLWRITDNFGLLPEFSAVVPVIGSASAISTVGSGVQGLNAQGAFVQFKLGLIIGRRGPRNEDLPPPPPPPLPADGAAAAAAASSLSLSKASEHHVL